MVPVRFISSSAFWRIFTNILLIFGAFLLPWWVVLVCACALFFVFDRFFELFLVAFLIDLLYGSPLPHFFNSPFVLSIGAVAMYVVFSIVKKRMRF